MKRLAGIAGVFLLVLIFGCSTGESKGGDSPVVPMPSPPIAGDFPITVDFGQMPDGPVVGPTEVGPVGVDGDGVEVQGGDIIIEGGSLRVVSPDDFQQAAVLVRELDGYSSTSIEGYDTGDNLLTLTRTGAPDDYYYARLSAADSAIRKVRVTGPNARVRKMILARPFSIIDFRWAGLLPTSWKVSAILSDDFNGDGLPDVAVGDSLTGRVSVLYGNPGGGVADAEVMTCDSPAAAMDSADLDGDAYPDLVTLGKAVNVYLGAPGGVSSAGSYHVGSDTEGVDIGDLNGDGVADIAVATRAGVFVLGGAGSGLFEDPQLVFATDARAVQVADMNGDERLDIIAAAASPDEVYVLDNDGAGNFSISGTYPLPGTPVEMRVARFNWDEEPDVAVLMASSPNWQTLINDGGALYENQLFQATEGSATVFRMIDINNDGFADMAVIDPENNEVSVFIADIGGNFIIAARWDVDASPISMEAADLDGDSRNDLLVGEESGNVDVYANASR